MRHYWLMKSEPSTFSIDDLANAPNQTTFWDGVRNYQARNFMRDNMRIEDGVFFYHSNCPTPGIVGLARVSKAAHPDLSALNRDSPYYDPKSTPDNPRWFGVDVQLEKIFEYPLSLSQLKILPGLSSNFALLKKGNRLSVMPVSENDWFQILEALS